MSVMWRTAPSCGEQNFRRCWRGHLVDEVSSLT
jgi:hypothetical protein